MTPETRRRLRLALSLARQRAVYAATPRRRRLARFFQTGVDWATVGAEPGDAGALVDFTLRLEQERAGYLVTPQDLAWLRTTDPFASRAATITRADDACAHRIEITNLGRVDLGPVLEWNRDPITGTYFPRGWFSARPAPGIDERYRAELNCHRHFPALAAAWVFTGHRPYADALLRQWTQWLAANPPLEDSFLNDGLETTVRIICWTHCLRLLGAEIIDPGFCLDVLVRIERYGHLIERQYRSAGSPNNHQIAEALGLLFIGLMYPELAAATRWRALGIERLCDQVRQQFLPGGVHAEQSAAYHVFVLECLQLALLLGRRNNVALPALLADTAAAAAEFVMYLMKPGGGLPALGDDCGLRLFTPTGRTGLRPRTVLAVGAFLSGQGALAAVAGVPDEEAFWFLGRAGVETLREAACQLPPAAGLRVFADAGHAIIRSGWDARAQYVHFDFGPHGLGERPGHAHDDILAIQIAAGGHDVLVDAGTHTYLRGNPLRGYFVGARAHNTIIVDADHSARLGSGPVPWCAGPAVLRAAAGDDTLSWVSVRHGGYAGGGRDVCVERSVLAVFGAFVLIVDRVTGTGTHTIETLWHLAADLDARIDAGAVTAQREGFAVRIATTGIEPASLTLHRGDDPVQPGWYAERYGALAPAPVARTVATTALPVWQAAAVVAAMTPPAACLRVIDSPSGVCRLAVDDWAPGARTVVEIRCDDADSSPRGDGHVVISTGRAGIVTEHRYVRVAGASGRFETGAEVSVGRTGGEGLRE